MDKILLVGVGGFFGSIARYGLGGLAHRLTETNFPIGTLLVNLLGCLAVGVVMGFAQDRQFLGTSVRTFLVAGFLGGFTTFSAFGLETLQLLEAGRWLAATANAAANVTLGLLFVWLGAAGARFF